MPEINLLDTYLGKEMAKKLKLQDLENESLLKDLLREIKQYTSVMEMDDIDALKARKDEEITPKEAFKFYRSHERIQYIKLILQYLIFFLSNIPLEDEIRDKPANPFKQFKEFVNFNTELLRESDVIDAVLREYEKQGVLNERNEWYYRGQVDKCFTKIKEIISGADRPLIRDYRKLFEALQGLCSFWFSVRSHNLENIRISDVFIYKLTWVLLRTNP